MCALIHMLSSSPLESLIVSVRDRAVVQNLKQCPVVGLQRDGYGYSARTPNGAALNQHDYSTARSTLAGEERSDSPRVSFIGVR